MKEEYVLVIAACENQNFRCVVLSDTSHPVIVCSLPKLLKGKFRVAVGELYRVDAQDLHKEGGTADILEHITDAKEIKQLRKAGLIPAEGDMPAKAQQTAKPAYVAAAEMVRSGHHKNVSNDEDVVRRNAEEPQEDREDPGTGEAGCEREEDESEDVHRRLKKSEKKKIREDLKKAELERKKQAPNLEAQDDDAECDIDDL
jgi:hypothetical protein